MAAVESSSPAARTDSRASKSSQEAIINGFNTLRQEQKNLANKYVDIESDLNEHKIVIDALKEVEPERKCFRMIGGVLVERTVKEILPQLLAQQEQLTKALDTLSQQLVAKGQEINEYKDKNGIKFRNYEDLMTPSPSSSDVEASPRSNSSASVLVST